jgi:hypothetical protein
MAKKQGKTFDANIVIKYQVLGSARAFQGCAKIAKERFKNLSDAPEPKSTLPKLSTACRL